MNHAPNTRGSLVLSPTRTASLADLEKVHSGVTRGTVNLANDWVYGLSNFPRAVLGTLGGTLAHVSLNEEYIKQHAADASAAEAGDVLEGEFI